MNAHEQTCFNDALHKLKVLDTEARIRSELERKLLARTRMGTSEQLSYLYKLEEALR